MQYKKDKHMQAYLMGGKKKINVKFFLLISKENPNGY